MLIVARLHKLILVHFSLCLVGSLVLGLTAAGVVVDARQQPAYRTLDDRFAPPRFSTLDAWKPRAAFLRERVLASAGLLPLPEKTSLEPVIFGEISRPDFTVSKVYFQSLPGFYVTGNLYRPIGAGPFPGIVSPHGHWTWGRLENSALTSGPGRAIGLARQGFVVFTYDMIGYNDSQQLPHTFGGRRENLWGLSLAGLQLWNSIRAVDFLESLPFVRRDALGATGESGGGTQTFLLAAVDSRVAVAAPVNMISLHMQGGCLCENPPGLRLDTTNVEIAATFAPKPLLMISATGDWTKETMELEYPAVRSIYELFGAADRVHAVRIDAEHNYNRESREAMYAWMARWLQQAPPDVRRPERAFTPNPLQDLLVFFQRSLPSGALTPAQLTDYWIAAAKKQLAPAGPAAATLRHALGFSTDVDTRVATPAAGKRTVLLAATDRELEGQLTGAGYQVRAIPFAAVNADAASKVRHFETYNRTAAGQLVADIVAAARANPGAAIVAGGDAALAALLASAVVPVPVAVLDVGQFDTSSDADFVERLYIPGLRRAGDLQTAAALARGRIVVHNAGPKFVVTGLTAQAGRLTPREIAALLGSGGR
jgi:dienelactone hydrolase